MKRIVIRKLNNRKSIVRSVDRDGCVEKDLFAVGENANKSELKNRFSSHSMAGNQNRLSGSRKDKSVFNRAISGTAASIDFLIAVAIAVAIEDGKSTATINKKTIAKILAIGTESRVGSHIAAHKSDYYAKRGIRLEFQTVRGTGWSININNDAKRFAAALLSATSPQHTLRQDTINNYRKSCR